MSAMERHHINEKWSSLGADAISIIAKHLLHLKYEPGDIKVWCQWAKQIDGPIFYEKPTPQTCTFDKTHKDDIVCESVMFLPTKYNIISLRNLKGICA